MFAFAKNSCVQSGVFLDFPFQFCSNIFLANELFQRRRHNVVPHKIYPISGVRVTVSTRLGVDSDQKKQLRKQICF